MIRLAVLLLVALAASACAEPVRITREALPVEGVSTAPRVRATGAWRLSATHPGFGGFSGMTFVEGELLIVSDRGWLLRWTPEEDDGDITSLPDACREGNGEHAFDAEAIALTPDGLELRVSLERGSRLCGFSFGSAVNVRVFALDSLLPGSGNRGVEAMATLPRHGTTLIAETEKNGDHAMVWFGDTPNAELLRYRPPRGFKPADATFMDDGRLIIVNRRHDRRGRATALTIVRPFAPTLVTEPLIGAELARIEQSPLAANYEGLAVQPTGSGATLWLISDDNFTNPRGTVLLRLELDDDAVTSADSARDP